MNITRLASDPTPPAERIAYQKGVANNLLNTLEEVCPEAFLAGGAPRDWFLETPARDLDMYTCLDRNMSSLAKEHVLRILFDKVGGLDWLSLMHPAGNTEYSAMEGLDCVFTGVFINQEFQIINMETQEDLAKAVERFDTSICKIWYKDGHAHYTGEFAETMGTRVIMLSEGYSWRDKHPWKIVQRFEHLGFTFEGREEKPRIKFMGSGRGSIIIPPPPPPRPRLPGVHDEAVFNPLRPWDGIL